MKTKSQTLAKNASIGVAATGAVFGLQQNAEAAIVYTDIADIVLTTTTNAAIDLDGGGGDFTAILNFNG